MFPTGWVRARTVAADRGESRARRRENFYEGFGEATRGLRRGRRARGPAQRTARGADRYPRLGTRGTAESAIARRADAHLVDCDPDAREHDEQEREALDGRAPSNGSACATSQPRARQVTLEGPWSARVTTTGSRFGRMLNNSVRLDPRRHRHFALAEPSPRLLRGARLRPGGAPSTSSVGTHRAAPSNRIAWVPSLDSRVLDRSADRVAFAVPKEILPPATMRTRPPRNPWRATALAVLAVAASLASAAPTRTPPTPTPPPPASRWSSSPPATAGPSPLVAAAWSRP